jgi:tetratricopeptide (TPR) repeat protein
VVLQVAEEQDFPIWQAVGSCLRGVALAGMGQADEGLAMIETAMNNYQRLKTPPVFWPLLLHIQAGTCGLAGRPAEGLTLLDEAIEIAKDNPGRTMRTEFLRLKGELLLAVSSDNANEAEIWLQQAFDLSTEVQARMLQLRAALSLSRLWIEQGKDEQARKLLGEVYENIPERSAIPDIQEAEALLKELAVVD